MNEPVIAKLQEKSGAESVPVVFEAMGIYSRILLKYLDDNGIRHHMISPLLSLTAECNYRQGKDDPIRLFNQKKRRRATYPMSENAAAHKILNILYALASNGQDYRC